MSMRLILSALAVVAATCLTSCGLMWLGMSGSSGVLSNSSTTQLVQINSVCSAGGNSVAAPNLSAQTAGNTNIVMVTLATGGTTVLGVTDSVGNIYTQANPPGSQTYLDVWYSSNIVASPAGSNTVTATLNQVDAGPELTLIEYSGLGSLDNGVGTTVVGGAYSQALATNNPSDLILCFNNCFSGACTSMTNSFAMGYITSCHNNWGSLDVNSAGNYTCSGSSAGGLDVSTEEIAFKKTSNSSPVLMRHGFGSSQNANNITLPYPADQISGDTIAVLITWNDTVRTITGVGDTAGNVYNVAVAMASGTNERGAIYYAKNIVAATANTNTMHVNFSGVTTAEVNVFEFSGTSSTTPFDTGTAQFGTSNLALTGNIATHFPNEIIVSAVAEAVSHTTTVSPGFVWFASSNDDFNPVYDYPAIQYTTAAGTYGNSFSLNAAVNWVALIAAFH